MLGQIQVNYSNKKDKLINKFGKMNVVSSDNAEMADKVVYKSMYNTTF